MRSCNYLVFIVFRVFISRTLAVILMPVKAVGMRILKQDGPFWQYRQCYTFLLAKTGSSLSL